MSTNPVSPNSSFPAINKVNLERHQRCCSICSHPQRADIDADFLHWYDPFDIAHDYNLGSSSAVYRHAHATGLFAQRRKNVLWVLERYMVRVRQARVTGSSIIRAVRTYVNLTQDGQWVEPPRRIIVTSSLGAAPEPSRGGGNGSSSNGARRRKSKSPSPVPPVAVQPAYLKRKRKARRVAHAAGLRRPKYLPASAAPPSKVNATSGSASANRAARAEDSSPAISASAARNAQQAPAADALSCASASETTWASQMPPPSDRVELPENLSYFWKSEVLPEIKKYRAEHPNG